MYKSHILGGGGEWVYYSIEYINQVSKEGRHTVKDVKIDAIYCNKIGSVCMHPGLTHTGSNSVNI